MEYAMQNKLELHTVCDEVWFFYIDIDEPRTFEVNASINGNEFELYIFTPKSELIRLEFKLPIPENGKYMTVVEFAGRGQVVGFIYNEEKVINKHPQIIRGKIVPMSD